MYSIRRTGAFVKLFLIISATGLFMYAVLAFCSFYFSYTLSGTREPYQGLSEIDELLEEKFTYESDLKYILLWTVPDYTEYKFGEGRAPFIKSRCLYSNCYITTSKNLLNEGYTKFEAIIFDINVVRSWQKKYMPKKRSSSQKYIFYSMEASDYSPVCNVLADNYFNWTWSYKLYSDIVNPFILVKKLKGDLVAPSIAVSWITNMSRVTGKKIEDLERKSKAVIWVINKCDSRIDRMVFVKRLKLALQKHSLDLDIFGCDYIKCPYKYCEKLIKNDYYFFLSYEYSTADDFVSGDVLKAYENDAVPIVLGGANYNQFLPYGSYINARLMTVDKLASLIYHNIKNPDMYRSYFFWKNHYQIMKATQSDGLCSLCELLNSNQFTRLSQYVNLRQWWYSDSLLEGCFSRRRFRETIMSSYFRKRNL